MFVVWSIGKSLGRLGVGAHAHVGDGQLGIVGNGGALVLDANARHPRAKTGCACFARYLTGTMIVRVLCVVVDRK